MARTKKSALKRAGSSSSLPENRPSKMQRTSDDNVKVKLEPVSANTAQQRAVANKTKAGVKESTTPVRVKVEPEDLPQGGVTVKQDPDAVSSSRSLLQQHQRAASKLESQEQPVQPRHRGSAAATAAAVKSENADPEHIDYPYGAAAAAATPVQPKRARVIKSDPEVDEDVYDDEDEDYDEEYDDISDEYDDINDEYDDISDEYDDISDEHDDASDDIDDYPDGLCTCEACMGPDDMYEYDDYGDFGCGCPDCLASANSDDSDQNSEVSDGNGEDADSSELPIWTWGKHIGTPIKETPGGYIHWLCREPNYFDGSPWKVRLLKQLIAARKVKIVNGVEADSPAVHVVPRVRNDDEDYGYWGYCSCSACC